MAIDSNTKLLLHFNGSYDDSSQYEATGTAGGSVTTSSSYKKFGSASAYFDYATEDRIVYGDSSEYDIGTDYTIDFWVYIDESSLPSQTIFLSRCSDADNYWYLHYHTYPTPPFFRYGLYIKRAGVTKLAGWAPLDLLTVQTWHHICITKTSSTPFLILHVDGVFKGSSTGSTEWDSAIGDIIVGAYTSDAASTWTPGVGKKYIDEVRISTASRIEDATDRCYCASGLWFNDFVSLPSTWTTQYDSYDPGGVVGYDLIYWEYDDNDDLQPRTTPADINYPTEAEVEFDVVYGYEDQYTGTLSGGGPVPTTPSIRIINNQDNTATATISGSDAGTTNTVWIFLRHGGVLELINAGSRTGNGTVGISKPEGEYIGFVVSTLDSVNSLPSNPDGFWISQDRQYLIRTAAAEAELQILRLSQFGIEIIFQNGEHAPCYTIWASMTGGTEVLQLRDSVRTQTESLVFYIPRQTGWPPAKFLPGATITLQEEMRVYEIDTIEASNGILERSSGFRVTCGNYRWLDTIDTLPEIATNEGANIIAREETDYVQD